MTSLHLIISGRVQGVYFRAYTQKQAVKLGVFGFVRNTAEGSVEVVACAKQAQLDKFVDYCHKGPLMAKVKQVLVTEYTPSKPFTAFEIH